MKSFYPAYHFKQREAVKAKSVRPFLVSRIFNIVSKETECLLAGMNCWKLSLSWKRAIALQPIASERWNKKTP